MVDWFIDVPHLIKCTRNHFLHHKIAQFAGHTVYHMFYQRVFEHQRLLGLKLVPKLKLAHIWPSTWQRMTVSLATQLYSKHMAMALKFLREDKKTAHLFNGSEATEKLTKLINDTFDILNGRHKDGWRLSIRSTIDLTEELLNPKNPLEKYHFVLTAKWNQDALEVYICKKKKCK
ncbi:hypothetical protein OUZ56_032084 [Daphnia magna]|uniref:Transposable element P transposase-like GTP-binding insertion domain-containing protein n=1 Tax=Daphnia magna TaxID=35525 RepID=A0ABQ9ZW73_9CRUS|nr:hypothetical protein OUZ56_032084 [Daphnia magna]